MSNANNNKMAITQYIGEFILVTKWEMPTSKFMEKGLKVILVINTRGIKRTNIFFFEIGEVKLGLIATI